MQPLNFQISMKQKNILFQGKGYLGKIVIVPDSQWEEHGAKYSLKIENE